MAEKAEVKRRHWADVAVILAGLMLWGFAIWPTPFADSPEVGRLTVWPIYAGAAPAPGRSLLRADAKGGGALSR
ncbi:hypothetical protein BH24GEM1_BH24GEM1_12450 [soil metagenome]